MHVVHLSSNQHSPADRCPSNNKAAPTDAFTKLICHQSGPGSDGPALRNMARDTQQEFIENAANNIQSGSTSHTNSSVSHRTDALKRIAAIENLTKGEGTSPRHRWFRQFIIDNQKWDIPSEFALRWTLQANAEDAGLPSDVARVSSFMKKHPAATTEDWEAWKADIFQTYRLPEPWNVPIPADAIEKSRNATVDNFHTFVRTKPPRGEPTDPLLDQEGKPWLPGIGSMGAPLNQEQLWSAVQRISSKDMYKVVNHALTARQISRQTLHSMEYQTPDNIASKWPIIRSAVTWETGFNGAKVSTYIEQEIIPAREDVDWDEVRPATQQEIEEAIAKQGMAAHPASEAFKFVTARFFQTTGQQEAAFNEAYRDELDAMALTDEQVRQLTPAEFKAFAKTVQARATNQIEKITKTAYDQNVLSAFLSSRNMTVQGLQAMSAVERHELSAEYAEFCCTAPSTDRAEKTSVSKTPITQTTPDTPPASDLISQILEVGLKEWAREEQMKAIEIRARAEVRHRLGLSPSDVAGLDGDKLAEFEELVKERIQEILREQQELKVLEAAKDQPAMA